MGSRPIRSGSPSRPHSLPTRQQDARPVTGVSRGRGRGRGRGRPRRGGRGQGRGAKRVIAHSTPTPTPSPEIPVKPPSPSRSPSPPKKIGHLYEGARCYFLSKGYKGARKCELEYEPSPGKWKCFVPQTNRREIIDANKILPVTENQTVLLVHMCFLKIIISNIVYYFSCD